MPTAPVNGIDVYYERSGEGPRLLFCNGSGQNLETSGMLVDVFTARFDTVAHDQRGLGRTAVPPGPYTMAEYAADALALADHVGWDTFRLVGTSPTLVASGRYDGIAPPSNSEAIASRIPAAELRRYDGGHAFFAQDGSAFGDVVTFLAAD